MDRRKAHVYQQAEAALRLQPQPKFDKTMKMVSSLERRIQCVVCGIVPTATVVETSCCEHKYCESCWNSAIISRICLICDKPLKDKVLRPDLFSSVVARKLTQLKELMDKAKLSVPTKNMIKANV